MGKGDRKSRRGKITLGTFGVRRRRKKAYKAEIKPDIIIKTKEKKEKELTEIGADTQSLAPKLTKEKPEKKTTKAAKPKKEEEKSAPAKKTTPKKEKS
jgi:30S ribosomal protein S31